MLYTRFSSLKLDVLLYSYEKQRTIQLGVMVPFLKLGRRLSIRHLHLAWALEELNKHIEEDA